MQYFKSIWNILDVLIILISYICIAFNIYRQVKVGQILDELLANQNSFADFEFLSYWQTQFNNIIAFTVFLAWIKVRNYINECSLGPAWGLSTTSLGNVAHLGTAHYLVPAWPMLHRFDHITLKYLFDIFRFSNMYHSIKQ